MGAGQPTLYHVSFQKILALHDLNVGSKRHKHLVWHVSSFSIWSSISSSWNVIHDFAFDYPQKFGIHPACSQSMIMWVLVDIARRDQDIGELQVEVREDEG